MARAYSDTVDQQQFQTFQDQRYVQDQPADAPRYAAEAPPPAQNWWQDDAYQRSDVVTESHTDPTGWKAGAATGTSIARGLSTPPTTPVL